MSWWQFHSSHLLVVWSWAQLGLLESPRSKWLHYVRGSLLPAPQRTPPPKTHCSQDREEQMETGSLSLQISQMRESANKCLAESKQQVLRTHFAVSTMPSSRDAALCPLQVDPRRPSALEVSITTGSDMAVGSQSVTEKEERTGC